MKEVHKMGAQGDVLFRRIERLPDGVREVKRDAAGLIVAHSETGHHHVIAAKGARMFEHPTDPLLAYVTVPQQKQVADAVDVVHHRAWDTHETMRLLGEADAEVVFEVRRQREMTPVGWARVND